MAVTWLEAQGYVSTPVVVDGHLYIHLQDQRFACLNLATGERTWTSAPFGKYCNLVAQGEKILALDQSGRLLLLKANPNEFQLLDDRKISEQETWAHLTVCADLVVVRELNGVPVSQLKYDCGPSEAINLPGLMPNRSLVDWGLVDQVGELPNVTLDMGCKRRSSNARLIGTSGFASLVSP